MKRLLGRGVESEKSNREEELGKDTDRKAPLHEDRGSAIQFVFIRVFQLCVKERVGQRRQRL